MAPRELAPYFGTAEKPECHLLYNASAMAGMVFSIPRGISGLSKQI